MVPSRFSMLFCNLPKSMVAAKNRMRKIAIPLDIWTISTNIVEEEDYMNILALTIRSGTA